jgi:AcrR family transcriptional regulator
MSSRKHTPAAHGGGAPADPAGAPDTPRARRRQAAEARILDAARSLLLDGTSVDSLSLREVARRADFTPGALYRYFADRDDLLATLFRGAGQRMAAAYPPRPEDPDTAWLLSVGLAYLEFARQHPEDLMLLFQHQARVSTWDDYVAKALPFGLVAGALADGARRGTIVLPDGLDAAGTAFAFWGLLHGMTELRRTHLRDVQGPFADLQRASLAAFIAKLEPTGSPVPLSPEGAP